VGRETHRPAFADPLSKLDGQEAERRMGIGADGLSDLGGDLDVEGGPPETYSHIEGGLPILHNGVAYGEQVEIHIDVGAHRCVEANSDVTELQVRQSESLAFHGSGHEVEAEVQTLPASVKYWTLTTLLDKLIKVGAKVVRHARYVTFQPAEVAVPRRLYGAILERIRRFAATPPRAAPARRG
jgi:hypothetical protein